MRNCDDADARLDRMRALEDDPSRLVRGWHLLGLTKAQLKRKAKEWNDAGYPKLSKLMEGFAEVMVITESTEGVDMTLVIVPNLPWRTAANLMGIAGYFQ